MWLAHCKWSRYFYIESLRCGFNRLSDNNFPNLLGFSTLLFFKGYFDVHILKGPPGLFSNPEVKLERVYGVVTWETSGEMCMTSNYIPLWGIQNLTCSFRVWRE
jgi:hypothetical protein